MSLGLLSSEEMGFRAVVVSRSWNKAACDEVQRSSCRKDQEVFRNQLNSQTCVSGHYGAVGYR